MVAENYTNTFGGENVSPANLSYVAYTISAPITLTWAFEAVEAANVTADKIDINCSLFNATVKLPPANQVTVGQDMLFGNVGAQPYVVTDNSGNTVCTITSGLEWFIFLTNNDTVNGVWRAVQFGASTSVANAATLDGAGLRANVTHLDQDLHTTALVSSYTITDSDRANVLQNGGGSVVYTFPDAGVVGNGWFVYIINAGSGNVDLTPIAGQTIDGAATKRIAPGESLAILSNGTTYHSLGYGRLVSNTITGTSIAVGGPVGTVVLSSTQANAQIQDYTGVLTGNRRIEYGSGIGYWFVYNNTTPATPYTMTMATIGGGSPDPGVIVPQGAFSILRSNGTTMSVAFSGAVGTVTSVGTTANLIGGPITSTGTLDLSNTTVTPGTYGDETHTSTVQVDQKGRVIAASQPLISIPYTQINNIALLMPPGLVMPFAALIAVAPPVTWLLCDGTIYNVATYPALGAALGAAYGGNGTTTFGVPDLRGRVIAGLDAGTGRLRNAYFPGGDSNTVGNGGGQDWDQANTAIPQLFVRSGDWSGVGGWYGGNTYGTQSVNYGGTVDVEPQWIGVDSGGYQAAAHVHNHTFNVSVNTGGEALGITNFGSYGRTDATNLNTDLRTNVQATMVMRWIIKT